MRPREEPDDTLAVRRPDAERELERLVVDLDVVIAYQNGVGIYVVLAWNEPVVEAAGGLAVKGDWC